MANFMFCTRIENSRRTIDQARSRVDQMESRGLYKRRRENLDLVEQTGIRFVRFGRRRIGHFRALMSTRKFADLTLNDLRRRDITPIVDLCHFQMPDWAGNFQNPDFPEVAHYAGALAKRHHWVFMTRPEHQTDGAILPRIGQGLAGCPARAKRHVAANEVKR